MGKIEDIIAQRDLLYHLLERIYGWGGLDATDTRPAEPLTSEHDGPVDGQALGALLYNDPPMGPAWPTSMDEGAEPRTLEDGWCAGCDASIEALGGPIRQSKNYDTPYREWACPACGHTEDDPDLTEDDLRDFMVPGWEMPEAPEENRPPGLLRPGAIRIKGFGWDLRWCWTDGIPTGHLIPDPFLPSVNVTPDMLRALGFTVEEG